MADGVPTLAQLKLRNDPCGDIFDYSESLLNEGECSEPEDAPKHFKLWSNSQDCRLHERHVQRIEDVEKSLADLKYIHIRQTKTEMCERREQHAAMQARLDHIERLVLNFSSKADDSTRWEAMRGELVKAQSEHESAGKSAKLELTLAVLREELASSQVRSAEQLAKVERQVDEVRTRWEQASAEQTKLQVKFDVLAHQHAALVAMHQKTNPNPKILAQSLDTHAKSERKHADLEEQQAETASLKSLRRELDALLDDYVALKEQARGQEHVAWQETMRVEVMALVGATEDAERLSGSEKISSKLNKTSADLQKRLKHVEDTCGDHSISPRLSIEPEPEKVTQDTDSDQSMSPCPSVEPEPEKGWYVEADERFEQFEAPHNRALLFEESFDNSAGRNVGQEQVVHQVNPTQAKAGGRIRELDTAIQKKAAHQDFDVGDAGVRQTVAYMEARIKDCERRLSEGSGRIRLHRVSPTGISAAHRSR